ncbi:hypothetical protein TNCT_699691 [Trichonephila clavata]|uniref:Uncharacterized protein n=1 Tax=Trichonephila clavata TaxID=2740835 RepID=A0A8X6HDF8_TRICU|nr:hypothetical protein TNCT_699691 [Trichonephila clavata]
MEEKSPGGPPTSDDNIKKLYLNLFTSSVMLVTIFRLAADALHMFYHPVSRKRSLLFLSRRAFLQTPVKEINALVF